MYEELSNYPPVLTVEDTAKILGVGKQLVRKQIADNKLPALRVGRVYRIPKKKFEEYLETAGND